jgi:cytochrome c oxidase cbb3-type subunit 3
MSEVKRRDDIQGDILHEYDGIEEADNHLPLWWLATFFGAIAFGAVYWSVYSGYELLKSPYAQYQEEAAAAAEASGAALSDEQVAAFAADSTRVAAGRAVFVQNCVICHGEHAEGKIGPNLTDNFWIHGGAPTAIFGTIRMGFAPKGMPQWGPVLGPVRTQNVAAFVLSLRNTHAANGKEPQGTPYDPAAPPTPAP